MAKQRVIGKSVVFESSMFVLVDFLLEWKVHDNNLNL